MPIYDVQLRQKLRDRGLDPDEFELVDDAAKQSATITDTPTTIQPKVASSTFGATTRAVGRGVIPTLVGSALGGAASGAIGGPWGAAAGLVTGIGSGILTSLGQDAAIEAISPELSEQLKADVEQHPVATTVGGILAAGPTFKPSISAFPGAVRAVRAATTGVPLRKIPAADVGNLFNVGVGATIQPALRLAQDPELRKKALAGDPEALSILGLETVGGSIFNEPTRLGKAIGLHPNVVSEDIFKDAASKHRASLEAERQAREEIPETSIKTKITPVEPGTKSEFESQNLSDIEQMKQDFQQQKIKAKNEADRLKEVSDAEAKAQKLAKKTAERYHAGDEVVAEHFNVSKKAFDTIPNELKGRLRNLYEEHLADVKAKKEALEGAPTTKEEIFAAGPETKVTEEQLAAEAKKAKLAKDLGVTEEINKAKQAKGEAPLESKLLETKPEDIGKKKYSEEESSKLEEIAAKRQEPLISGAREKGIPLTPSKALLNMFKRLGVLRNVHIDDSGRVFKTEKNALGEMVTTEVKGEALPREGLKEVLVRLNPFKQTIETAPHELTHPFIDDMKKFGSDRDKKLGTKMERYIETRDPEYAKWKDARTLEGKNSSVDEYLVTHTGEDVIRRVLKTDGDGAFKSFLKDFWSNVKTKYGAGDTKDFARLLSNRLINEAPFHEAYASHIKAAEEAGKAGASASKFSEEEYPSKEALNKDRKALLDRIEKLKKEEDKINLKYDDTLKLYGADSPEHQSTFAEMSKITRALGEAYYQLNNKHAIEHPYNKEQVKNAESENAPLDKESLLKDKQTLDDEFKKAGIETEKARAKFGEDSDEYQAAAQREIELFNRLNNLYPELYNWPKIAKNAEEEGNLPKSESELQRIRNFEERIADRMVEAQKEHAEETQKTGIIAKIHGQHQTKVPSEMMQFDRPSSSITRSAEFSNPNTRQRVVDETGRVGGRTQLRSQYRETPETHASDMYRSAINDFTRAHGRNPEPHELPNYDALLAQAREYQIEQRKYQLQNLIRDNIGDEYIRNAGYTQDEINEARNIVEGLRSSIGPIDRDLLANTNPAERRIYLRQMIREGLGNEYLRSRGFTQDEIVNVRNELSNEQFDENIRSQLTPEEERRLMPPREEREQQAYIERPYEERRAQWDREIIEHNIRNRMARGEPISLVNEHTFSPELRQAANEYIAAREARLRAAAEETQRRVEDLSAGRRRRYSEDEGNLPKKGEFFEPERRAASEKAPLSKGDLVDNLREFIAQAQKSVDEYKAAYKKHSEADLSKLSEKELLDIYKNLHNARRKFEDFDARFRNKLPENRPEIRNQEEEGQLPKSGREVRIDKAKELVDEKRNFHGQQIIEELNNLAYKVGSDHRFELVDGELYTKGLENPNWAHVPLNRLPRYDVEGIAMEHILNGLEKERVVTPNLFESIFSHIRRIIGNAHNARDYFQADKTARLGEEFTSPYTKPSKNAEEEGKLPKALIPSLKINTREGLEPEPIMSFVNNIQHKREAYARWLHFTKGLPQEEALAKALEIFPHLPVEDDLQPKFSEEEKGNLPTHETREPVFPEENKPSLGSFTDKTYNKKGEIVDVERPAVNLETNFASQRIAYQKWLNEVKGVPWAETYKEAVKIFPLEKPFVKAKAGGEKLSEEEGNLPRPEAAGKIPGVTVVRSVNQNTGRVELEGESRPFISFKTRGYEGFRKEAYARFLKETRNISEEEANNLAEAKRKELAQEGGDLEGFGYAEKIKPPTKTQEDEGRLPTKFSDDPVTQRLRMVAERNRLNPSDLPAERTKDEINLGFMRSEIDKIPNEKLRNAFTDFNEKLSENRGKYVNSTLRKVRNLADLSSVIKNILTHPGDYWNQNSTELNNVREWFDNNQDKTTNIALTENETKIRDSILESLQQVKDDQQAKGLKVGGFNPKNLPQIPSSKVIRELQENPRSETSTKYKQQFLDYQINTLGKDRTEAEKSLATFLKGFASERINIAEQYTHLDKPDEFRIPPEWREKNLLVRLDKFMERVARRFAYKDAIQSKEGIPELIKEYGANTPVSNVYDQMVGINPKEEQLLSAAGGLVRSGMMGTLTGATDFATNITLGMQHQQNPLQTIKSALSAWANMSKNVTDSFASGRNRTNLNALEWSDLGDLTSGLRRLRDVVSDVQGRNFLEQMTRATAFGMGRFTTLDFHQQLQNGNLSKQGKRWFDTFGKDVDWKKPELTPEDVMKISGRYVDSVQGTYDYRGLPHFAVEGSLSPVFALARWNIEKANNFVKHVVNPLVRDKNPYPALMATLGGVLGGAAITKLREELTGRKEKTAKPEEIAAIKSEGGKNTAGMAVAYKLMGLASASGYAGVLGDIAKGIMDVGYGRNKPQWYNNVLLDAATNLVDLSASFAKSTQDNGLSWQLTGDFIQKALEDRFQTLRIILAHASAERRDEIERANKFRDLRVYNTLAGNPIRDLSTDWGQREFGPDDMKEFKRTGDIGKAAELLPQLISKALDKASGDPEAIRRELSKIKRNSYQTMPNPDILPLRFLKYLTYLEKSQGKEAATNRLTDYMMQNAVNRAKTAAVP